MFSCFLRFRLISPISLKMISTTRALQHSDITSRLQLHTFTSTSSIYGVPRFYSQEAVSNLPVVDFEYVKRATSLKEVIIVDVREPEEIIEHGKIPNSVNIPLGTISSTLALSEQDFERTFKRVKPKENSDIIFYCMIGKRSAKAQQIAFDLGFKNVKNYLGSWKDWAVKRNEKLN